MVTTLADDELLVETRLPLLAADTRWGFSEFSRRAGDYGLTMALAVYREQDGVIAEPRIGIGGAEGRPRRIAEAEAALAGKAPGASVFEQAGKAAAAALDPMGDNQASAPYRRELAAVMVARALAQAAS